MSKAHIPLELLFGNPEKTGFSLSPNGELLAFCAPTETGAYGVWIQAHPRITPTTSPKLLFAFDEIPLTDFSWAQTSKHILFMRDTNGNENWQLFAFDLETEQTSPLTRDPHSVTQKIYSSSHHPDRLIYHSNTRDKKLFDLYEVSILTGETRCIAQNTGDIQEWYCDSQLNIRGALHAEEEGSYKIIIDEKYSIKLPFEATYSSGLIAFSPNGRFCYYADASNHTHGQLFELDTETNSRRLMMEDPTYDLSYSTLSVIIQNILPKNSLAFSPETGEPLALYVEEEKGNWRDLSPEKHPLKEHLIYAGDFVLTLINVRKNEALIKRESATSAPEYYLFEYATRGVTLLGATRPRLQEYQLATTEYKTFPARDGLRLSAYLTRPSVTESAPFIIMIHGGPWARETGAFNHVAQFFANRGYGVLSLNFRGSAGFGKKLLNAGNKEWGYKMREDIVDAYEWAFKKGFIRGKRCALFGRSYGGYATLNGLFMHPELFRCGIADVSPTDITYQIIHKPRIWETQSAVFTKRMGDAINDKDLLDAASPLNQCPQLERPLLISHGKNDARVNFEQHTMLVNALQKANKQALFESYEFENEGHKHYRASSRLKFFQAIENFLARNL